MPLPVLPALGMYELAQPPPGITVAGSGRCWLNSGSRSTQSDRNDLGRFPPKRRTPPNSHDRKASHVPTALRTRTKRCPAMCDAKNDDTRLHLADVGIPERSAHRNGGDHDAAIVSSPTRTQKPVSDCVPTIPQHDCTHLGHYRNCNDIRFQFPPQHTAQTARRAEGRTRSNVQEFST